MTEFSIWTSPKPSTEMRSEVFWGAALERLGHAVQVVRDHRVLAGQAPRIVLAAKPPVESVQAWMRAGHSVVLWLMDQIDYNVARLRWFEQVAPLVSAVAIAEPTDLYQHLAPETPMAQLLGTSRTPSSLGVGLKPSVLVAPSTRNEIAFLTQYATPERVAVCRALVEAELPLHVYGTVKLPAVKHHPALWETAGHNRLREAQMVLSVSNQHDRYGMTSNRLFNAAAMGACIVAKAFPGCTSYFHGDEVAWCEQPQDFVAVIQTLRDRPETQLEMRDRVYARFWADHTWDRRVSTLLWFLRAALGWSFGA